MNKTKLWFGHGCTGDRMHLQHERYCGMGMDTVVTVCTWNTNAFLRFQHEVTETTLMMIGAQYSTLRTNDIVSGSCGTTSTWRLESLEIC